MGMWVGRGRKARAAYGFDDIALVPGSLTINPTEVDISWDLCGRRFEIPIIAAAMDGVVSPRLAIEMGRLGGLAVLNLEGIFSRYENPDEVLDRIISASLDEATKIIQGIYGEPIKEELIHKRIAEIKKGGGPVVVSADPPARRALRQDRAGSGRRLLRRPVHRHHRAPHRHRVHAGRSPQAQEAPRHPAHRRQRGHLRGLPRADGLRRRTRSSSAWGRARRAPAARCSGLGRAAGDRHRGLGGGARLLLQAHRAATCPSSPTAA